jgi:hypothetical protein
MRRTLVLVIASLLFGALPAIASPITDPNDVRGRLDLRSVSFSKLTDAQGAIHLRFRWITFENWTIRQCRRAQALEDGCRIEARLDTKGPPAWRPTGKGIDYAVKWGPEGCIVVEPATDHVVTQGASYKGSNFAACTFRRSALTIKKSIRWYAFTQWANVKKGWYATDYVPNQGWVG